MFDTTPQLHCGRWRLPLNRPLVMGIVNVTPDSFSDGGHHASTQAAIAHALYLVEQGADIVDIGGESTRPGATPVSIAEEIARVIPVVEGLANQVNVPISVDTFKAEVMQAALQAGASIINDVQALRQPGTLEVVANSDAAVVLMHAMGGPYEAGVSHDYEDIAGQVHHFLAQRLFAAEMAGIARNRLIIDPGYGFNKNTAQNMALLAAQEKLLSLGVPLLAGLSRKRCIAEITGRNAHERLAGSLAAHVFAVQRGAQIVRVHDVAATVDALKIGQALEQVPAPPRARQTLWPGSDE